MEPSRNAGRDFALTEDPSLAWRLAEGARTSSSLLPRSHRRVRQATCMSKGQR